ncbi:MAG: hypothetical protein ACPHHQ_11345, partial [Pseudomonadales bacterium]
VIENNIIGRSVGIQQRRVDGGHCSTSVNDLLTSYPVLSSNGQTLIEMFPTASESHLNHRV